MESYEIILQGTTTHHDLERSLRRSIPFNIHYEHEISSTTLIITLFVIQ